MSIRVVLALLAIQSVALAAPKQQQEIDTLGLPPSEVKVFDTAITLPAIPSFELPPSDPSFVEPRHLRVLGKKLVDTQVKVRGYVVWIYDCIEANKRLAKTRKQVQKLIDDDPTKCERPKFYLASTRDTSPEQALWVVDVPRPPNKLEKERLPKEQLDAWPAVPKFKLGDYVQVTGDFKVQSPHNERNSDGLVVYAAMEPVEPARAVAPAKPAAAPTSWSPPATTPHVKPPTPMRAAVEPQVVNASNVSLARANKEFVARRFPESIELYRRAVASWDGNHLAWYGIGLANAAQGDWKSAVEGFEHAAKLRPDSSMYRLWAGIASYEASARAARAAQAARPADSKPDDSSVAFDNARSHLTAAIALEPTLWRAHYYLGRMARDGDSVKTAAESFSRAIASDRTQQGPYVALGELYRRWDYTAEAIAVTQLGASSLAAGPDASDVHYVLGMAYDDQKANKEAIAAFTRALELKPDNYKALFQRGQVHFRLKKYKDAKVDLEAFLAAPTSQIAFARAQAEAMLAEIPTRKR